MAKAKTIQQISDLTPDPANVNAGTERGHYQLDWSLTELGAGRSILADADGVVIAGNKTLEIAADHQLPIRVIETDGQELVVVQRTDLRLLGKGAEASKARQLAIADNRISETNYSANLEMLLTHQAAGIDLGPMYREDEIAQIQAQIAGATAQTIEELWQGMPEYEQQDISGRVIHVHFESEDDVRLFAQRMEQSITDKTRSIWFPYKEPENLKQYQVGQDEP